LRTLSHNG